ncbi:MAG: hypothetical protein HIU89_11055 [Proteobacteria bacterium]|nr:hypothetical protein [Pseudomonadota bacterium]
MSYVISCLAQHSYFAQSGGHDATPLTGKGWQAVLQIRSCVTAIEQGWAAPTLSPEFEPFGSRNFLHDRPIRVESKLHVRRRQTYGDLNITSGSAKIVHTNASRADRRARNYRERFYVSARFAVLDLDVDSRFRDRELNRRN